MTVTKSTGVPPRHVFVQEVPESLVRPVRRDCRATRCGSSESLGSRKLIYGRGPVGPMDLFPPMEILDTLWNRDELDSLQRDYRLVSLKDRERTTF